MGPLSLTDDGNKFILIMQDDLSKYSYAESFPNHEARTIASKIRNIIRNSKNSVLLRYHPQFNGALERSHLTLKEYLKHHIVMLPFVLYAYNLFIASCLILSIHFSQVRLF